MTAAAISKLLTGCWKGNMGPCSALQELPGPGRTWCLFWVPLTLQRLSVIHGFTNKSCWVDYSRKGKAVGGKMISSNWVKNTLDMWGWVPTRMSILTNQTFFNIESQPLKFFSWMWRCSRRFLDMLWQMPEKRISDNQWDLETVETVNKTKNIAVTQRLWKQSVLNLDKGRMS